MIVIDKIKKYLGNSLKHFISFNIQRPKLALLIIFLITIFFTIGISKLRFETSLKYLMPEDDPVYKLGVRANIAFLDSETFIIASIEAINSHNLFSTEVFSAINKMVNEISEYKDFDLEKENQRLLTLMNLSGVFVEKEHVKKTGKNNTESRQNKDIEAELDEYLLNNQEKSKDKESLNRIMAGQNNTGDLWDLTKPLNDRHFEKPLRPRQKYNYSNYRPVTLSKIREALNQNSDENAISELDTILYAHELNFSSNYMLSGSDFKNLMEAWEDLYLFKSMEIIQIFMNPITGKDISGENNRLKAIEFIERDKNGIRKLPVTAEGFYEYQKKIRLNPLNKNFLYSENEAGNIQAFSMSVILKSQEDYVAFSDYFVPLMAKYNKDPLAVNAMGSIVLEKYMSDYMKGDLLKYMPIVLAMIVLTFYFNFRSFIGVLLPALNVIIAGIWTMGLMGFLSVKISLVVSILPPMLIALGSSYPIYIFNQYLSDNFDLRLDNGPEELSRSISHIAGTVILAGGTTIISFLTLVVNDVTSLRDFGIFASLGAFLAMLIAMILIPAGLIWIKPARPVIILNKPHNAFMVKVIHSISYLAMSHSKKMVFIFLILLFTGIWGIFKIKTETAPLESFKKDSPIRIADNRLNKLFSGTVNLTLIIDSGKKNGALDPEFLNWVENLRLWLDHPVNKEQNSILSNYSFSDIIKRMNMAFHSDNPDYFKIPGDKNSIRQYTEIFSGEDRNSDGRPDQFEQFIDRDYQRVNLIIRTGSYKNRTISSGNDRNIIRVVNEYLQKEKNPNGYQWFFVGTGINMLILSDYIESGQLGNVGTSLVVMIIIVFVFFKRVLISVLSMIPLFGGLSIVYGMMGFLGIPLDIPRAILSSIVIGDGIDYTIHFLKVVAASEHLGKPLRQSISDAYEEAGISIIYTSMALVLGFGVLTLSSFTPIFSLGLLVSSIMSVTALSALLFMPAFIILLHPEIKDEGEVLHG